MTGNCVSVSARMTVFRIWQVWNRPFSYSRKESELNDVMMQFEEISNVHNGDRASNATRSNLTHKIV